MFGSFICFAIYFSEKQADGGSSKDFLLPVILVVILMLISAVIGAYLTWKKKKCFFFRKKGNILIDVDVIYRIQFSMEIVFRYYFISKYAVNM